MRTYQQVEHVVSGLRSLHKTELTKLAGHLDTAISLRAPKPPIEETEHHEKLASGYTLAQAHSGSRNSALRSNKHALLANFRPALLALLKHSTNCRGFINEVMEAVSTFGINLQELKDIHAEETMGEERVDGMTGEERQLWSRGIGYIKSHTTLISEERLR